MTLAALISKTACYSCLPDNQLPEQVYLLGQISGIDTSNTNALSDLVKCWQCYDDLTLAQIEAYLLWNLSGSNVEGSIEDAAACYACQSPLVLTWLETYLWCFFLSNEPVCTPILDEVTGEPLLAEDGSIICAESQ